MKFKYQAKDQNGNVRVGVAVAENQQRAEALLEDNGLVLMSLEEVQQSVLDKLMIFGKTVPAKEMVLFSRQLSTLISAQVPILQSMRILLGQLTNRRLKQVVGEIITDIEGGDSLSLSMSRYPEIFTNVFVNVIHSGEMSGTLDKSFLYLADQVEKDYDLNSKVKGAMTYPMFILGALILIGSFMFLFVLPKLTGVLTENGGTLPVITVWLISFTHFFQSYWWLVFLIAIGLVMLFRFYINTHSGRYVWDTAKIKAPIVGDIFVKIYVARFARSLSTLVAGGIPIIKALQIVAELVNNVIYRDIILEAADHLAGGKTISSALMEHKEVPVIVSQMIQVGEQTATLSNILGKLAAFYEKEVDGKIGSLTTLIEPIIILILGLAVGILVAGILLPIYNLGSSMQ